MADKWFCGVDGEQYGPYTWAQMRAMAVEGRLIADSYVRREIDDQWFAAARVPGLISPPANSPEPSPPPASNTPGKPPSVGPKLKRAKPLEPATAPPMIEPPVGITAPPVSVPVGLPVGSAIPNVSYVSAPAGVAPANPPQPAIATNEKRPRLLLVGALGGACAVVAAVAIGLVVWNYSRSKGTETVADVPIQTPAEDSIAVAGAEANPGGVEANPVGALAVVPAGSSAESAEVTNRAATNVAATTAAAVDSPLPAAATASQAAAAKILSSLPKFTDVSKLRRLGIDNLNVQIASVWLAADEAGTRVDHTAGAEANAPAKGRFVFVEIHIRNEAGVVKKYKSWNAAQPDAAILADEANHPLPLIPITSTPGITRLGIVNVQPNQSVTDVLVFAAPKAPIESLRLALAKTALADRVKLPSHFALEIPLEVLTRAPKGATDKQSLASAIVGVEASPSAAVSPSPAPKEKPEGESKPATAPEAVKPKGPPTIAELNQQIEELAKKREAEMQKASPPEQPPGK